jgi:hypothetical protein
MPRNRQAVFHRPIEGAIAADSGAPIEAQLARFAGVYARDVSSHQGSVARKPLPLIIARAQERRRALRILSGDRRIRGSNI